jgi:hypothetical protein
MLDYLIYLGNQPPNPHMEEWLSLIFVVGNILMMWPLLQWAYDTPLVETGKQWHQRCLDYDRNGSWWRP